MLVGNNELITAPVRDINAKVEALIASTDAKTGEAVRLEECLVGTPLNIQLSSRNLIDCRKFKRVAGVETIHEQGSDYVIASGAAGATPGTYQSANGRLIVDLPETIPVGTKIAVSLDFDVMEQVAAFDFPRSDFMIFINGNQWMTEVTGLGTYHYENTFTLTGNLSAIRLSLNSCKVKYYNICVSIGEDTTYTPFVDDFDGIEVSHYGKNLFDADAFTLSNKYIRADGKATASTGYKCIEDFMRIDAFQGRTITLNHPPADKSASTNARAMFYTGANESAVISGSGTNKGTMVVPNNAYFMRFSIPSEYNIEDVQIELGEAATDYEPYVQANKYPADEDGSIDGEIIAHETNTLVTYKEAIITASYEYLEGQTFRCIDNLSEITIDRAGETKFFGFGIGQKANIKLIDTGRAQDFTTKHKFKIYFDDICVSPEMRVTEVHRDETTNELSITTYDVLNDATAHYMSEISLPETYTLGDLAAAIANILGVSVVIPELDEFNLAFTGEVEDIPIDESIVDLNEPVMIPELYEDEEPAETTYNTANFEGTETFRAVLTAIAEATQTVYFMNTNNELVFKRLNMNGEAAFTIDKEQYIDLTTKANRRIEGVCSATELGDNYEAKTGLSGTTQYVRNNPLWELRDDVPQLVDAALAVVAGMTIGQFDCSWRGNYLVEPADKIALITKDGNTIFSYLVNDTISYNGAYSQHTYWEYVEEETEHTNPTTLGEVLKQTYAKVDKANKEIEMVVSEAAANTENIAQLHLDVGSVGASVVSVEQALVDATDNINSELATITDKVNATMTSEEIKLEISTEIANGISSVETSTGFTFNQDGLTISKSSGEEESDAKVSTQITNNGMGVYKGNITDNNRVLTANDVGVEARNLHATTYLIIGDYSRLENYGTKKRTACFWIG